MKKINKILLVDDDDINNFISLRLLEKIQIAERIKIVKNGKEGLAFIKDRCGPNHLVCPELIILDYKMPVMDGIEFLEELKKIEFANWHEVIFLALTANFNQATKDKFKELGVQEFSDKPLSEKKMLEVYNKYWAKGVVIE